MLSRFKDLPVARVKTDGSLVRELPLHLRYMTTFSRATGLRAANVTGLTWGQVDLSRKLAWVHPDQAKARKAIAVPLNDTAMEIMTRQVGEHPVHAFTYQRQPVKEVTRAWYNALKRGRQLRKIVGIEDGETAKSRAPWQSTTPVLDPRAVNRRAILTRFGGHLHRGFLVIVRPTSPWKVDRPVTRARGLGNSSKVFDTSPSERLAMATVKLYRGHWVADYYDANRRRRIERPDGRFENRSLEKQAAEALLAERLTELGEGIVHAGRGTFEDAATRWLKSKVRIRPSTRRSYEQLTACYLVPYFANRKLRVADIERFRTELSEGLPESIRHAFAERQLKAKTPHLRCPCEAARGKGERDHTHDQQSAHRAYDDF